MHHAFYELWNTRSRNRCGEYDSQDAALAAIRRIIAVHGRAAVEALALNTDDGDGHGAVVAHGAGLAALAELHERVE